MSAVNRQDTPVFTGVQARSPGMGFSRQDTPAFAGVQARGPGMGFSRQDTPVFTGVQARGPHAGCTRTHLVVFATSSWLMSGIDVDAGTLTYRTWTVNGRPDFSGLQYGGPKSGASPLANVSATKVA